MVSLGDPDSIHLLKDFKKNIMPGMDVVCVQ